MRDTSILVGLLVVAVAQFTSVRAWAVSMNKDISVTLFGQPCTLSGPLDETSLRTIHRVSPEQLFPLDTAEQLQNALDRLKKSTPLPVALDTYRDQLTERLEARLAFMNALVVAKKTDNAEQLLPSVRKHLKITQNVGQFESLLKKAESSGSPSTWKSATLDQLKDAYNKAIAAEPEEEFHRAIRRIKVKYQCSFGEGE